MTDDEPTVSAETETYAVQPTAQPAWVGVLAWCVRALARVWVVGLLVFAAAFAGIGVYKTFETRAELTEMRKAPGPQPYAVVAYRRELARQIRAYSRNWNNPDAVPQPPPRPRLLSEIDAARDQGAGLAPGPARAPVGRRP
jgi:hypothetical protein